MNHDSKVVLGVLGVLGAAFTLAVIGLVAFLVARQPSQSVSDEEAIRQEFARVMASTIDNLAPNEKLSIEEIQIEDQWAIVESTVVNKNTGEYTLGEGTIIIFKKGDNGWEGAKPGIDKYETWLDEIPSSLIPEDLKEWLR